MKRKQLNVKKPVTLITGYLGAGKTTVMNALLKQTGADHLAIIVNDMGSMNLDASLIQKSNVMESNTKMIEMTNGCICCTLQDAFMEQIIELSKQDNIDRILVEASGISDPSSIALGFLAYQQEGMCDEVYLDSIVTVADADRIYAEFLNDLCSDDCDEDPDIINLVIDQIEFCNVILLNKCDLLKKEDLDRVKDAIRCLQKDAEIIECIHGNVDADRIFCHRQFDFDKVLQSSIVQQQLHKRQETVDDEHGITSFLFEEKRPFVYEKFMHFLENEYPENIIRAKGYVWFIDDDIHVQLFEQAGRNASVTVTSNWLSALDEENQEIEMQECETNMEDWDEIYGDRINQIVFIGKKIDCSEITTKLEECISDEYMK